MRLKSVLTVLLGVIVSGSAVANPITTIGFEDFNFEQSARWASYKDASNYQPVEGEDYKFPYDGYQGLNWSGQSGALSWVISVENEPFFSGSYAQYGPVTASGHNYAWSNGGAYLTIGRESGFDFISVSVRQGQSQNVTNPVVFYGYLDNAMTYTSVVNVGTDYQEVMLNFKHIDQLKITNAGSNLLLDDLSIRLDHIPEPSSIALIGVATAGLGFARRRKV